MRTLAQLSPTEFRAGLEGSTYRALQKIHLAIGAGVAVFLAVVVWMYLNPGSKEPDPDQAGTLAILTALNLFVGISAILFGFITSRRILSGAKSIEMPPDPTERCISFIRTASIIQLATFEGASFFGLVTVMLAIQSNIIYTEPLYAINGITALAFLGYVVITYPTADRLEAIFQDRIHSAHVT